MYINFECIFIVFHNYLNNGLYTDLISLAFCTADKKGFHKKCILIHLNLIIFLPFSSNYSFLTNHIYIYPKYLWRIKAIRGGYFSIILSFIICTQFFAKIGQESKNILRK